MKQALGTEYTEYTTWQRLFTPLAVARLQSGRDRECVLNVAARGKVAQCQPQTCSELLHYCHSTFSDDYAMFIQQVTLISLSHVWQGWQYPILLSHRNAARTEAKCVRIKCGVARFFGACINQADRNGTRSTTRSPWPRACWKKVSSLRASALEDVIAELPCHKNYHSL